MKLTPLKESRHQIELRRHAAYLLRWRSRINDAMGELEGTSAPPEVNKALAAMADAMVAIDIAYEDAKEQWMREEDELNAAPSEGGR